MKAIYKFICASLLVGSFTSCNDMLDTVPQGQFTAEQLDDSSVEGLVASAYAGLEAHFYGNNEAFAGPSTNWIFDVRSDDAYPPAAGKKILLPLGPVKSLPFLSFTEPHVEWARNFNSSHCSFVGILQPLPQLAAAASSTGTKTVSLS